MLEPSQETSLRSPSNSGHSVLNESWLREAGRTGFELAKDLWPLNRSLTGEGNRETLRILQERLPELEIHEVPTGFQAFDWTVPKEWVVNEAWIKKPDGTRMAVFADNNLHLVGYSQPTHQVLTLDELQPHLHSQPDQPRAVPYVTSYYSPTWGFCVTEEERRQLSPGDYEVFIDAEVRDGFMTYGELVIRGTSKSEIFLSTYICHPSMANNELSGIVVATGLAQWLSALPSTKHTYRLVFLPETIGPLLYLQKNLEILKENVVAGFVLTCVGDDRAFSYLPSRKGDSLADRVAQSALRGVDPDFLTYSWLDRQSDERQYCAPHVDLPVASVMRTKYGSYPEYHTSLDRLGTVVTEDGLAGALLAYGRIIQMLELDFYPVATKIGEPQLGRRGLYPTVSKKGAYAKASTYRDILGFADGKTSLRQIADMVEQPFSTIYEAAMVLEQHDLLSKGE